MKNAILLYSCCCWLIQDRGPSSGFGLFFIKILLSKRDRPYHAAHKLKVFNVQIRPEVDGKNIFSPLCVRKIGKLNLIREFCD